MDKQPEEAWEFGIAPDLTVTMLRYADRPYIGVDCIVTVGVSLGQPTSAFEYVMVFDPVTLPADGDLYALLATFLQLHHVEHVDDIGSGTYLSSGVHLIRPYEFVGFYLCLTVLL
ncbi:hypothetical protein LP419_27020 [Massilia sp. H-1]|nr:hypothetical protein LP419_27020 [Massilia sp. H-1]